MIGQLLSYQLLLAYRQRSELIYSVIFFLLVVSLFPLAMNPEKEILRVMAPGIIWVAALLASSLSAAQLFSSDFYDGTLEQALLSPRGLMPYVLAKILAHWMISGLPLIFLVPLCGLILYLPFEQILVLWITLWLGTPAISLVTAMAVAFTVGLRQGGILLALLVFPLYVPVLIFATSAVAASLNQLPILAHLALLAAYLLVGLVTMPYVTAYSLKQTV